MNRLFATAVIASTALMVSRALAAPDVYLVTIDTLRADHVHCYGDDSIQTPALDSLAKEGFRFTQAFTPSPLTNTSHTSILTGLLPSVHGVTDFGIPLAGTIPTWAELLQQHGYQTAAFIGAVVLDAKTLAPGLDRGFDEYDNFPQSSTPGGHWGRVERRGEDVVRRAETWMAAHTANPRFVWVHLYDPHDPYEPPPPFAQQYKDHPYDGEVAYADQALGNLLAYLKQANRYRQSLIIVVGDHGEGLGEHGEQTHGIFLYDATTHVPLLIKLPGAAAARVIEDQVQTTDILPTVLDLVHIVPPDSLAHRSLQPLLSGSPQKQNAVFGETDYPLRFGWAPLRSVRSDGFKLIEAPRPELYELAKDPSELKNAYALHGETVQRLRAEISSSAMRPPAGLPATATTKTLDTLRALGDASSKDAPAATRVAGLSSLPDPKDKIEEQNVLHTAMMMADQGHVSEARASLEKLVSLDPGFTVAWRQLGDVTYTAGDYKTSADAFRRVVAANPDDPSAAVSEAKSLEKSGDFAGARRILENAVTSAPGQLDNRLLLARLDVQAGDRSSAEDQFQGVLLLDPANHEALLGLGRVLLDQKRFGEAVELLEGPVGQTPGGDLPQLLIQAYQGLGRQGDAEKLKAQSKRLSQ